MIILTHVLVALLSIVYTSFAYLKPTPSKLPTTYLLFILTLISGTYLVWIKPTHLAQSCLMGLAYFTFVAFGIVSTTRKLAKESVR